MSPPKSLVTTRDLRRSMRASYHAPPPDLLLLPSPSTFHRSTFGRGGVGDESFLVHAFRSVNPNPYISTFRVLVTIGTSSGRALGTRARVRPHQAGFVLIATRGALRLPARSCRPSPCPPCPLPALPAPVLSGPLRRQAGSVRPRPYTPAPTYPLRSSRATDPPCHCRWSEARTPN